MTAGLPRRFVLLPALLFAALAAGTYPAPQERDDVRGSDVVIARHAGDLVRKNEAGGFLVDRVDGRADLMANGSIKVGTIDGDLTAITTAGDIEASSVAGGVIARTQAGNVFIERAGRGVYVQAELGEVKVFRAGSLEVQNIFGGDVKAANVSGPCRIRTKGNILFIANGRSEGPELCRLASAEGDITLYLPENAAADLEIRTPLSEDPSRESRIESEFKFGKLQQRLGMGNVISLTTRINAGGPRIDLYIEKGNIFIRAIKPGQRIPFLDPGGG